jgi:hypothetical protein
MRGGSRSHWHRAPSCRRRHLRAVRLHLIPATHTHTQGGLPSSAPPGLAHTLQQGGGVRAAREIWGRWRGEGEGEGDRDSGIE